MDTWVSQNWSAPSALREPFKSLNPCLSKSFPGRTSLGPSAVPYGTCLNPFMTNKYTLYIMEDLENTDEWKQNKQESLIPVLRDNGYYYFGKTS